MKNKKLFMVVCFSVCIPVLFAGKEKKIKHLSAPVKNSNDPAQNLFEVFQFLDEEKKSTNALPAGFAAYLQQLISSRFQNKIRKL